MSFTFGYFRDLHFSEKGGDDIWYDVVIPERVEMGHIHDIFKISPLTSMIRDYIPCGALLPLDIFKNARVTLTYIYRCLVSVSCCEKCTNHVHNMLVRYCKTVYQKGEEDEHSELCCVGNFYSHLTSSMKGNLLTAYDQCEFSEETKAILITARRTSERFERNPLREVSRGPIPLYDYFEEDEPAQEFCDEIYKIAGELREGARNIIYDGYFLRNFGRLAIEDGTANPEAGFIISTLLFGTPAHLDAYRRGAITLEAFSSLLAVAYDRIEDSKLPISAPMREHMTREGYDLLIATAAGASSYMRECILPCMESHS